MTYGTNSAENGETGGGEMGRRHTQEKDWQKIWEKLIAIAVTVVRVALLAYVILIVYLCFYHEFTFFTWHPLLMSIGWVLFMCEGILIFSKANVVTGKQSYKFKSLLHWIVEGVAVSLVITAFVIAFVNKERNNRSHFTSNHGLYGFIGIVFSLPAVLIGILAFFGVNLRQYIKPNISKLLHIICGFVAFLSGSASVAFSINHGWFQRRIGDHSYLQPLCLTVIICAIILTLLRPMATGYQRLKNLF